MNEIVPIYKPLGVTPLETIVLFRQQFPSYADVKISYAGRLDPMAEGLLLILIGDVNKRRHDLEKLEKMYEFSFLLGLQTDTYDLLGIPQSIKQPSVKDTEQIVSLLASFQGEFEQEYPPYSSKTVQGRPLFSWAREGKLHEIVLPKKQIHVESCVLISQTTLTKESLFTKLETTIPKVQGDFRQEKIVTAWQASFSQIPSHLPLITCSALVSSGTYIRGLVQRIGEKIGCGAVTYSLCRTRVGEYSLDKALCLERQSS